ncbi:chromosome segregation protein SMC [Rhodopila sp.]|uniref:chromosome segregation protein SMC n=1 Tax=Rhodopila sp. TaxID=2480087 RepID=UPI002B590226|nr:chromosome segregation protein SMC [Rhodopila sp.]HVZ06898.1 chromosome segregation protein SMC [Rhodopila sp.]
MPVSFRRLRIAGFKSFAEPTAVEILPGLTGIVGPNGCGKSNVVEALRWAMGESSARNLRGGEMEDVIFAGTAGRASRNIAEVTLVLDETVGKVPPPFHEQPELEIVRRIERGSGSAYRINGKEVRARDVQTLFADIGSGARTSAMVSQGRVTGLVNARPEDRRGVLEEAANITGLHARRHEAELKLRAAEANLARAEDLRGQLEAQLAGLKRQARQASRYRNISGTIRTAEAELLSVQRARVDAARAEAAATLAAAEQAVAEANDAARLALGKAGDSSDVLPALREREAEARTVLERHRIAQEQIAGEEQRARTELAEAERRLGQIRNDLDHARQLQRDAAAAEERLGAEEASLAMADDGYEERAAQAEAVAVAAAEAVRGAEAEANRATEAAAEANARAQAATQMLAQAESRATRVNQQFQSLTQDRARVAAQQVDPAAVSKAAEETAQAEAAATAARQAVEQAEQARAAAATALTAAREAQAAADSARARLAAEAQALAEVLAVKDGERWPPMIDSLTVAAGLEAALGAVLGEELTSALDPNGARYWVALPAFDPVPALPACATPLSSFVQGPPALARVLSQIGLVENEQDGGAQQTSLRPGQSLVSRAGAIWRWDGYTIRSGTPTQAAVRLQQRNRLNDLRARLGVAEQQAAAARAGRTQAEAAAQSATQAEQQARAARRDRENALERARAALATLRNQANTAAARLAAVDDQLARVSGERDEAQAALDQVRQAQADLPDIAALRDAVTATRTALSNARAAETSARTQRDSLAREYAARANRRKAIAAERGGWAERAADAAGRVTDLAARQQEAEAALGTLQARPAEIAARRAEALDMLKAAEEAHRRAAQEMSAAQAQASETDRAARAAEAAVAARRENLVRAEAALEQASHAWGAVAERILERLGVNPDLPEPPAELTQEAEDKARRRLERLQKEREEMGPVNLRAEQEVETVEEQIATIEKEREELTTAIAKLRGSIGHLNREGRERLTAVFQEVDRNFQQLFTHMFGGGRAHLALVGSDDPLQAGLEIYAQPPGKKLAILSLLSGGEQALTALSLIFAVFRCNPAPVCVLDEVDAPLDDANVDRFCTLLEDMVRDTGTRFLVVTHHPMTMARMDRLYGVTMQERGVSRLLSVDLAAAAGMVEHSLMAAE